MPVRAAKAAFLWRLNTSNFKAVYGRYPENMGDTSYSKNYLQVRGEIRDKLNEMLGYGNVPGAVTFEWCWPNGHLENRYDNKDSNGDTRGQLYVTKGTGENKTLVLPFAPGPLDSTTNALIGDPFLPNPQEATALLQQIEASGICAWFMAVVLEGEKKLHARVILENPPAGKEQFGIERQPAAIQKVIRESGTQASIWADLRVHVRATDIVAEIQETLPRSPNILLIGPPGCGKSVAIEDLRKLYNETAWFDAESYAPWRSDARKVYDTAFYPAMSYESFVAGLSPKEGEGINLEVRSGPFIDMAQWCRDSDREGLLLIDEFNRGAAAAIFGDMLVLLDKEKRSGEEQQGSIIAQPHSSRDIDVPEAFASAGPPPSRRVPKEFTLPINLKIIGAFNGSDRSVAALDAALLRRFAIVRVGPDPDVLARHLGIQEFDRNARDFLDKPIGDWLSEDVRRLAVHILISLNNRILRLLGADHELGHALLWEIPNEGDPSFVASALAAEFEEKVVGRLQLTLRNKDEVLAAILNAPEQGDDTDEGVGYWLSDDSRIGRMVGARLQIRNLKHETFEEMIRRLRFVVVEQ